MSQATLRERKHAFLRRQKLILAKSIHPSNRLLQLAEHGAIPDKVLRDIMLKVDRDLKRHGKNVYSTQMTNHIVEQIDVLYWEAGAPTFDSEPDAVVDVGDEDQSIVYQGEDLTLDSHISKLPSTWDASADPATVAEGDIEEVDQGDYMDAAARLQNLSARRLILQQKLDTYRTLLSLLEPYRAPQENIQPNLVGRDAPLAPELAKTRTLAIRVAGRIAEKYGDIQFSATAEDPDDEMLEVDGNTKLKNILGSW